MNTTEYTVEEMRSLLKNMSGMYDLARVVDPIECRILSFHSDGTVTMNETCYGIWNAGQKCINCSSAVACRTGCHQEKAEHFRNKVYHIQSNPVTLKLPDGDAYDAVVELVSIENENDAEEEANDRAAENIDHMAAQYQSIHDEMTMVLNAGAFYELARGHIIKNPALSWVLISANIMNFRLVNTLFGVLKGNEVLIKTAEMLKRIAEDSRGLCGRLGSDQFALLLPQNKYSEDALLSVQRELAEAFNAGIYTFIIHFGVYEVDDPSIPISVMYGRANSALRTIRESLKDTVAYFDSKLLKKLLFEQEVIGSFQRALREGQFHMYLQPLAREDGDIFGAEALARWIKPDGSMVMPGDFIEVLEQAGFIHELDMFIWECAIRQLSAWKDTEKKDLMISVNMSAKDFFSVDVYRVLSDLVEKYQVEAGKLRLEITETALLEEPESCDAVIRRLRKKGFVVEIDDFGKGHSSISMLKDIQADVMKIDMSLLHEVDRKPRSKIILKSIIGLANDLGMEVITEGVETEEQLKMLSDMGCHLFQGFYFSHPLPAEEFERVV